MARQKNDELFMRRAITLSLENVQNNQGGPFAAVITKDDTIIAEGVNLVTATHDPTAHAEIIAIRRACQSSSNFQLVGCTMYTTCEPCPMCFGAIYWARLQSVIYGNTRIDAESIGFDDSFIYDQLAVMPEKRSIPMTQLLHEEAQQAFVLWQQSQKKIRY